MKKDFGLTSFDTIKNKISNDFKESVGYYLNNKYYKISESTFGKPSKIIFEDCEVYDFNEMKVVIENILTDCINFNLKSLKRRELNLKVLPKEFSIVELQKQIKNNLDSFKTVTETKRNVYSPDGNITVFDDINTGELKYPIVGTLLSTFCVGYDQYGNYADGNGGKIAKVIELNSPMCGYVTPGGGSNGGGDGGGGGSTIIRDIGNGPEKILAEDYRTDNLK